jgi:hypothetical protein
LKGEPEAMPINILIDAHLITLRIVTYRFVDRQINVGRTTRTQPERVEDVREIPPRQDTQGVSRAVQAANQIWAPADIIFIVRATTPHSVPAPNDAETVDRNSFFFLARQFPALNAVSLLLVSRVSEPALAGEAVNELSVCLLPALGDPLAGNTLAHELGHLLSLGHVLSPDPLDATDVYNLMYPGARAGNTLTTGQINTARQSALAQRFAQAQTR